MSILSVNSQPFRISVSIFQSILRVFFKVYSVYHKILFRLKQYEVFFLTNYSKYSKYLQNNVGSLIYNEMK